MWSKRLQRLWPLWVALLALIPAAAQAASASISPSLDFRIWEMIRASGLIAYVLLSVSMIVGIAVRIRALDWLMKRAWVLEGHQTLSVLALVFTGGHMVFTLMNHYLPFTVLQILIPFASGWRPVAMALGIVGFYLLAVLTLSSWLRPVIGQKTWRTIHYSGFACWVAALAHGVFSGSDTSVAWVQWMYLVSAAAVGLLIIFRVLTVGGSRAQVSQARVAPSSPGRAMPFDEAGRG